MTERRELRREKRIKSEESEGERDVWLFYIAYSTI
jgi:hypothetical protein